MLQSQVNYWTLVENKRHNLATEGLTNKQLNETIRHNVRSEDQVDFSNREIQRHNLATEDISNRSLNETIRHNSAQEGYWNNSLAETVRHNYATESISREQLDVSREANAIGWANANTNRMNAETSRQSMLNSYALGLESNRIQAMNAETNIRQADIAQMRADTEKWNVANSISIGYTNANANVRYTNSQIARNESEIGRNTVRNVTDVVNAGTNVAGTTVSAGSQVIQSYGNLSNITNGYYSGNQFAPTTNIP